MRRQNEEVEVHGRADRGDPAGDGSRRGATVAKRHGVSEQAIYPWKKRFGSFQPDDVRRLNQLEQENARLKKLVAERDLEIAAEQVRDKSPTRQVQLNSYRDRRWETRDGTVELRIPELRKGSYFPDFLEPRRMAEKALAAVV